MKKHLAIILAVLMVLTAFSGCGSSSTQETTAAESTSTEETSEEAAESAEASETTSEEESASTETTEETASAEEESAEETSAEETSAEETDTEEAAAADGFYDYESTISFPLDETMTVTVWNGIPPFMENYLSESTDMSIYQAMEEMTNIHLDITFVNGLVETEQFNLMSAADAWTDIVVHGETMYGSSAYDDGIFVDLKSTIQEYCPNLTAYIENDESLLLNLLDDDGHILSFPKINYDNCSSEIWGMAYRGDYLDALGLETPTTIDEFEETMTAVYNEFGSQVFCGSSGLLNFLYYAYDLELAIGDSGVPLTVKDGEIHFGYYDDAVYDYFTKAHEWLESGLLYSEWLSVDSSLNFEEGLVLDGSASTGVISLSILSSYNGDLAEGEYLTGGSSIKLNEDDTLYAGYVTSEAYNDRIWSISTLCDEEKIPAIAAYVDYFFTEPGYMLINWGVEGESYTIDEEGVPHYTELITNNPEEMSYTIAQYKYATVTGTGVPMLFDVNRDDDTYTEDVLEVKDVWTSCYSSAHKVPSSLVLSTEENEEFQAIWGDLSTYIEEMTLRFLQEGITEEEYQEFHSNLETYGVQTVIDLYQAAYDRYNSKAEKY